MRTQKTTRKNTGGKGPRKFLAWKAARFIPMHYVPKQIHFIVSITPIPAHTPLKSKLKLIIAASKNKKISKHKYKPT